MTNTKTSQETISDHTCIHDCNKHVKAFVAFDAIISPIYGRFITSIATIYWILFDVSLHRLGHMNQL